jgi:hypothetical protein
MTPAAPDLHPFTAALLSEVEDIVADVRGPRPRRLDVDATARRLDIVVERRDLGSKLLGLTLDERRVLLHDGLKPARAAFTFAHEMAHLLHRRGHFRGLQRDDEEWFADWFARELLLPRLWLRQGRWAPGAFAALHVGVVTAALQLAVLGRAPGLMRHRDHVLCRNCGTSFYRWGCGCAGLRRAPADRLDRLTAATAVVHFAGGIREKPVQLTLRLDAAGDATDHAQGVALDTVAGAWLRPAPVPMG